MYQKKNPPYTFSHGEDCLREVRRQRLHAALDLDSKNDRHIKWSLRLLQPLFGKPLHGHESMLQGPEDVAINALLLLRREAGMTPKQIAYLCQLDEDRRTLDREVDQLTKEFKAFTGHLKPTMDFSLAIPLHTTDNVPRNPIAWSDELRRTIEGRVNKWKGQRKLLQQMYTLISASNEALGLPEDSFDDLDSET